MDKSVCRMHENDTKHSPQPEWKRFFPAADHRWAMGLRRGNAAEFLAPSEVAKQVRAERSHWLKDDPHKYAALTPVAETSLNETVEWARSLGVEIDASLSPWEQLLSLGRAWEVDFVWLVVDEVGIYRVAGGVVCFPSSWALQAKLGCTLSETHHPVAGLNAALGRQIDTFLNKLVPEEAWLRENAGYCRSADRNQHPTRRSQPLDAAISLDEVWVRLEHQMLLKMPLSKSVLFAIRVEVVPLQQVLESAEAAANLARHLITMSPAAAEYKGLSMARDAILLLTRR
ncbi:MAG: DUF3445 domain-containing protein [Planctomycetaceae bacterium]|nr:DUF3445 domain-containing protein [Planctomycetaceae bacterium]